MYLKYDDIKNEKLNNQIHSLSTYFPFSFHFFFHTLETLASNAIHLTEDPKTTTTKKPPLLEQNKEKKSTRATCTRRKRHKQTDSEIT